ncbi:hypothetical protein ABW19_dt0206389 [Dactylella cylindrospora]|nr:hypothetical protein ABW19_dt0206389 [Dactylella cylindrospora]
MARFRRNEPRKAAVPKSTFTTEKKKGFFGRIFSKVLPRKKEPVKSFSYISPPILVPLPAPAAVAEAPAVAVPAPVVAATPAAIVPVAAALEVASSSSSATPSSPPVGPPPKSTVPTLAELFASMPDKMKALEESRKNVPRYLFRACSPMSGGGIKGLNTEAAILPHAFLDGNGHKSLREMGSPQVRNMANGHLRGQRPPKTDPTYSEFSSWAASLSLVLQYGHNWVHTGGLICVLDRYNLPKDTTVYHCPALQMAGMCDGLYCHEYLVHGPVRGPGFKAVPVKRLVDLGLYTEIPIVLPASRYWWGQIQKWDWEKSFKAEDINTAKVKRLKKIAAEFGENFTLAMTVAFTTVERRNVDEHGRFNEKDVKAFLDGVSDLEIPEEFNYGKNSIVQDGVYIQGYPMVGQLVELMRGLVEYSYGKGARQRQRKEMKDLTKKLKGVSVEEAGETSGKGNRVEIEIHGVSDAMLDAIVY